MTETMQAKPELRHARRSGLRKWIPGYGLLLNYNRELFRQDAFAGLVLTALLAPVGMGYAEARSEEHTSELQSRQVISYAVFCLKKKKFKIQEIPSPK